jgi:hypothetical protein
MIATGSVRGKCWPTGFNDVGGGAAIRTEAMTTVPVEERLAFGERRQVIGIDQTAHGDRAQVGYHEFVARLERFRDRGGHSESESRRALQQAEKDDFRRSSSQFARFCEGEQGIANVSRSLQHDQFPADHVGTGTAVIFHRPDRGRVDTLLGRAFDRTCGITKAWLRPKIGARGHARAPAGR